MFSSLIIIAFSVNADVSLQKLVSFSQSFPSVNSAASIALEKGAG